MILLHLCSPAWQAGLLSPSCLTHHWPHLLFSDHSSTALYLLDTLGILIPTLPWSGPRLCLLFLSVIVYMPLIVRELTVSPALVDISGTEPFDFHAWFRKIKVSLARHGLHILDIQDRRKTLLACKWKRTSGRHSSHQGSVCVPMLNNFPFEHWGCERGDLGSSGGITVAVLHCLWRSTHWGRQRQRTQNTTSRKHS